MVERLDEMVEFHYGKGRRVRSFRFEDEIETISRRTNDHQQLTSTSHEHVAKHPTLGLYAHVPAPTANHLGSRLTGA
jgi:hypothetical protein